ncbi:hypothetical protein BJ742DRAFT_780339 [Cladochytrium replicatum]|nr:hypothetical protein BJ742DRAFT_780339 [Cladochytrium replicatum]
MCRGFGVDGRRPALALGTAASVEGCGARLVDVEIKAIALKHLAGAFEQQLLENKEIAKNPSNPENPWLVLRPRSVLTRKWEEATLGGKGVSQGLAYGVGMGGVQSKRQKLSAEEKSDLAAIYAIGKSAANDVTPATLEREHNSSEPKTNSQSSKSQSIPAPIHQQQVSIRTKNHHCRSSSGESTPKSDCSAAAAGRATEDPDFGPVITVDREDEDEDNVLMNEWDFLDYPLMEKYDFRHDDVNANLGIDLQPRTTIKDYQEKSLSKMLGNGLARSGITVLPTGVGKTMVGIAAAAQLKRVLWCYVPTREFVSGRTSSGLPSMSAKLQSLPPTIRAKLSLLNFLTNFIDPDARV